jgi:hypothetical protein
VTDARSRRVHRRAYPPIIENAGEPGWHGEV